MILALHAADEKEIMGLMVSFSYSIYYKDAEGDYLSLAILRDRSGSMDKSNAGDTDRDNTGSKRDILNRKRTKACHCNKSLLPADSTKCCGHRDSNRSRRNSPGNNTPRGLRELR